MSAFLSDWLLNCCWPSPAQWFRVRRNSWPYLLYDGCGNLQTPLLSNFLSRGSRHIYTHGWSFYSNRNVHISSNNLLLIRTGGCPRLSNPRKIWEKALRKTVTPTKEFRCGSVVLRLVLSQLTLWIMKFTSTIITNPVPTSQRAHCVSITNTYLSTALQPFVWSWPLFQFLDLFTQSVGLLGRGISPLQGRYLHTGQHKHRINAHRHPCFKWDSNPRSQCFERAKAVHSLDRAAIVSAPLQISTE
jgi:hypothetical protein